MLVCLCCNIYSQNEKGMFLFLSFQRIQQRTIQRKIMFVHFVCSLTSSKSDESAFIESENVSFYLQQSTIFLFDVQKGLHFFIDECSKSFEMRLPFKRGVLLNSVNLFNNHLCWNVSFCFVNVFSKAFLIFVHIS